MSKYVVGTGVLSWDDYGGKKIDRPIKYSLDVRERTGEPGQALLIIAANTHLSVSDLERLLGTFHIGRSRSWIQRRRWLLEQLRRHSPA